MISGFTVASKLRYQRPSADFTCASGAVLIAKFPSKNNAREFLKYIGFI